MAGLSNMDKHTDLHAVGFVTGAHHKPLVLGIAGSTNITIHEMEPPFELGRPIEETYLTAFRATPPDAPIKMEMQNVAAEVVFRNGAEVQVGRLPSLVVEVRAVFDQLRPFL